MIGQIPIQAGSATTHGTLLGYHDTNRRPSALAAGQLKSGPLLVSFQKLAKSGLIWEARRGQPFSKRRGCRLLNGKRWLIDSYWLPMRYSEFPKSKISRPPVGVFPARVSPTWRTSGRLASRLVGGGAVATTDRGGESSQNQGARVAEITSLDAYTSTKAVTNKESLTSHAAAIISSTSTTMMVSLPSRPLIGFNTLSSVALLLLKC